MVASVEAYGFSAKGASLYQPGATPQEEEACCFQSQALKARLMMGGRWAIAGTTGRAFSISLGRCPRLERYRALGAKVVRRS
jgi:hypothetical protein